MEFLPENKKRLWIYLALIGVSILGSILIFKISGRGPADEALPANLSGDGQDAQKLRQSSLLPYGAKIDISITESEEFNLLRASPELLIGEEELGKFDLFTP